MTKEKARNANDSNESRETKSESDQKSDDQQKIKDDRKLKRYYEWQDAMQKKQAEIDGAKSERSICNTRVKRLEKELNALISTGPEGNTPLIDLAEEKESNDPDAWTKMPIEKLDLPAKKTDKIKKHFSNLGDLAEWINNPYRSKKSGIDAKLISDIMVAFEKFHEPIVQKELESVLQVNNNVHYFIKDDEQVANVEAAMENNVSFNCKENFELYLDLMSEMKSIGAYQFAEDMIASIYEWVESHGHITEKQIQAIENIRLSVNDPIDGVQEIDQ